MNSDFCTGIDNSKKKTRTRTNRLETDKKWYYVPPYTTHDDDIVVDAAGQLIAVFERKEDALICVETHNKNIK